jgi:zinc protease
MASAARCPLRRDRIAQEWDLPGEKMGHMKSWLGKIGVSLLLVMWTWPAAAADDLNAPLPVNPQLRVGKLENGLTYYIQRNTKPDKRVELRLVVKAGSILEDDDQQGLAHFTEHMAFDGTRHFAKHDLISYLQSLGVKFGADLNAYTSFNETVYILPIPTDKPDNLATGFQVLEDWAQGVTMDGEAIDKERNVVLEEARLGKGADDRMMRKLLPEMFNGSRYAKRLPIGKESLLKTFPHSAIRRFYADWYRPDIQAVFVIGDIDPDKAEQMVRAYFGALKNPAHERPRTYPEIPTRVRTSAVIATDREATMDMVRVRYPITRYAPEKTLRDYRDDLVRELFTSMLGQRLQEVSQQEDSPFVAAFGDVEPVAPGYRSFAVSAIVGRRGAGPALAAMVEESKRAAEYGFNADELEQAKKTMFREYETAYKERDKTDSGQYATEYIRNFLVDEPIPGIENEYKYVTQMLPGITLDEINACARKLLPAHAGKLLVYMGSSREKDRIPTRAQLLDIAVKAERAAVKPWSDRRVASSLMAHPPVPGTIVSEREDKQLGTDELTLSNGLKVILKPTDFKNDQVLLAASRFGGSSLVGLKDKYSARYASSAVYAMGLGPFTPVDLSRVMAGKTAFVVTASDAFTDNISGASGRDDLESMFQLLYMRMQPPRQDKALFRAYVSKAEDMARDTMSDPDARFSDMVQTTLYRNNPRLALIPKPGDFAHVDLDRVLAIYHDRFASAKGFTFVVVGSFDVERIKRLIATYIASLPTADLPLHYKDLGVRPVEGVVKKELHAGVEAKSRVALVFTGPATWSRPESLRFQLLQDAMNLRIIDVLREKLSLIYSGGMGGTIERIPYGNYRINVVLPCAPENVDKVVSAMLAEVGKMQKDGPTPQELEKITQTWMEDHAIAMRRNGTWAADLRDAALYGTDPEAILEDAKVVNSFTAADIRDAARRYLNTGNYLEAVLYPDKAARAADK